ncbi:hypothetical protein ACHWQZ_G002935 [Mnemiopsis leidyi]
MLRCCCLLLLLVDFGITDCRRSTFVVPIVHNEGQKLRQFTPKNIYGCRGHCDSGSVPEQVNNTEGHYNNLVMQVNYCKCCSAMEYELKTFSIPTRQGGYLHEKTYKIWSAVTCGCQMCGPDSY